MNKKSMRFRYLSVILFFVFCLFSFNLVFADTNNSVDNTDLEKKVNEMLNTNSNNIDVTKLVDEYEELSKSYSNDEIADMIEKNKDKLAQKGINQTAISAGTNVLRTTDSNQLTKILKEDIDVADIQNKINEGYSTSEIVENVTTTLSTYEKMAIFAKLLFANKIFKASIIVILVLIIYFAILRWIIYIKAGRHGFAAIIPIYRDIVYFKVCKMSPWVLLFILLPIIGWLILLILKIISRFELAYSFGRKSGFGLGLWFFAIIFESIIVFDRKIKYIKE